MKRFVAIVLLLAFCATPANAYIPERWAATTPAIVGDIIAARSCSEAWCREYRAIIALAAKQEGLQRLSTVNNAVNIAVNGKDDPEDVWQPPSQTLTLHTGDCEDYAILKYAILRSLGVEVRLVIGMHKVGFNRGGIHAVVIAKEGDDWYVLNNLARSMPKLVDTTDFFQVLYTLSIEDGALR